MKSLKSALFMGIALASFFAGRQTVIDGPNARVTEDQGKYTLTIRGSLSYVTAEMAKKMPSRTDSEYKTCSGTVYIKYDPGTNGYTVANLGEHNLKSARKELRNLLRVKLGSCQL